MYRALLLVLLAGCRYTVLLDERDTDADLGTDTDTPAAVDADADGYTTTVDCDDGDEAVHPGAPETCDGVDEDCDGVVDGEPVDGNTFYVDGDGDGHGTGVALVTCDATAPEGYAATDDDCDDGASAVHPGANETCNGVDDDCDGVTELDVDGGAPTWFVDADGDDYGSHASAVQACAAPGEAWVQQGGDCNDASTDYNPDASRTCDGTDHDCDGKIDFDEDQDGALSMAECANGNDCDDADATNFPDRDGLCAHGTTCADLLARGVAGDGPFFLDPDGTDTGVAPFEALCLQDFEGGGWTLAATVDWGAAWTPAALTGTATFGALSETTSFKGAAWHTVPLTDLLFVAPDGLYARYDDVGDGTSDLRSLLVEIPDDNCGTHHWPMTAGTLVATDDPDTGVIPTGGLCSTDLYIDVADHDGNVCHDDENATGPAWSIDDNSGCPLDDPSEASLHDNTPASPWGDAASLSVYVR